MNLYGDTGNIITLLHRAKLRNIDIKINTINTGDQIVKGETDIYFFGGGQDSQQEFVVKDLPRHQEVIKNDIENGAASLSICGGYQLFGHYFKTNEGNILQGIDIFDVVTNGSRHRMIGNVIVELESNLHDQINEVYPHASKYLVGFENHSGETIINSGSSIGRAITGSGNNYTSKQEGYWYRNAFGTYLHGSLLPKNPHLADYLIYSALKYRYGEEISLNSIDDSLAWQAHQSVLNRYSAKHPNK